MRYFRQKISLKKIYNNIKILGNYINRHVTKISKIAKIYFFHEKTKFDTIGPLLEETNEIYKKNEWKRARTGDM